MGTSGDRGDNTLTAQGTSLWSMEDSAHSEYSPQADSEHEKKENE